MKKSLKIALFASVSFLSISFSVLALEEQKSENFKLDEQKVADYETNKAEMIGQETPSNQQNTPVDNKHQIIVDEIPGGRIEKLVDDKGKVIAQKKIENDKVVEKILNYYHPNGSLARQVTTDTDGSFYAEEFYSNGVLANQSAYLSEDNKIGKEKIYDAKGKLRQEVFWGVVDADNKKPKNEQKTIRKGKIITYYPNGNLAAIFPTDGKGVSTFYTMEGHKLKEIKDTQVVRFGSELTKADCMGKTIHLTVEDLVELYEDEGDISYNKCGLPYRETFMYEVNLGRGNDIKKLSFDDKGMLRRITPYFRGQKHGIEQKFDSSGNVIAEIIYENGTKDGEAIGRFPTGEVAFEKNYVKGKIEGSLTCYFPTGEEAAKFYYKDGKKEGIGEVYGAQSRKIEFKNNEIVKETTESKERQLYSKLPLIQHVDKGCLDFSSKQEAITLDIDANENTITEMLGIKVPHNCRDIDKYEKKNSRLMCIDSLNQVRVSIPAGYIRGDYVQGLIFSPDGKRDYEVSYYQKQRQGWTKRYNREGKHVADIFYNKGELAETSRSYYKNGAVKEMITISEDGNRKVLSRYTQQGDLEYSLSYKDGERNQSFIFDNANNKDIFITYYDGKLDNIREVNAINPTNFIEYDLATGEYIVVRNNTPIKGGKICGYEGIKLQQYPTQTTTKEKTKTAENKEFEVENAIIPTQADKKQKELASQNIGPVSKPEIKELTEVVEKANILPIVAEPEIVEETKVEKLYYPNGNLRKTIKTKGSRTEEVKEYSKTGLLLTDTIFNEDTILTEKYYGSGQIRMKTTKTYDDNAVMSFVSRTYFYDNGNTRYDVSREENKLLFTEKTYYINGKLKTETIQTSPLSFIVKEYNKDGALVKHTQNLASTILVKNYENNELKSVTLNGKDVPVNLANNDIEILKDGAKEYGKNGELISEVKVNKDNTTLVAYYSPNKVKSEISFYDNGEIYVKEYSKEGEIDKFAYLATDGKLHLQKPETRVLPSYRERYWVDYNNPNWIENSDQYSIKSIARLYLDTASYILADLKMEVPDSIKKLYSVF
jgi:antitoxin component YwqK of YwqJK toxin-antitoxin module